MDPGSDCTCTSYTFPDTPPERLFDRLLEQVRTAEDAGFDLITVMDHLYQIRASGRSRTR